MFGFLLRFFGAGRLATSGVSLSSDEPVPAEHPLRETLDGRYHRMRAAMAAGDPATIGELLTTDFVSIDIRDRRSDARAMIEALRKHRTREVRRTAATTLTAIDARDGEARVVQRYVMHSDDANPRIPRALWTQSTDVWRNEDGVWRLALTRTDHMEVLRANGRRITLRRI